MDITRCFEVVIPGGERVEFNIADECYDFLLAHRASGMLSAAEWDSVDAALDLIASAKGE